MARRTGIWMAAAFLAVLIVPVAPAAAGGGCHQGVTNGDGDTVEMVDFVLHTGRPQSGKAFLFGRAIQAQPADGNFGGAFHLGILVGH